MQLTSYAFWLFLKAKPIKPAISLVKKGEKYQIDVVIHRKRLPIVLELCKIWE
jgi:hypothetical protein